jgi:tripeptide aminopeptidase
VQFHADLKYESFLIGESEPSVQAAKAAAKAIGLEPETRITNGGLDANWMSVRGLPTVTLGCGQQNPHTVDEALHIESYLAGCRMGLLLATGAV